jgi:hypothetical protein
MNGELVRLPSNPPTHAAWGFCSCSISCDRFLWGGDVVLRDLRGQHHNVICAIKQDDLTREEMLACDPSTIPEGVIEPEPPKRRRKKRTRR